MDVLAVDVGGTTIRAVEADETGLRGDVRTVATDEFERPGEVAAWLAEHYSGVEAVGVVSAGDVDRDAAVVERVANWSGWSLDPIADELGCPLVLENDADGSAIGLRRFGAVDAPRDFVYLTLSSGIGAGVVRDGRLVPGVEAGFVTLDWDGEVEHFGVRGPWEGYASGGCFPDRVAEWLAEERRETALEDVETAKEVIAAADDGDEVAREYYTRLKRANAAGIGTLTNLFAPDLVVVGGSVATHNPALLEFDDDPYGDDPRATEPVALAEYTFRSLPEIEVVGARDDLELKGAAAVALDRASGSP